VSDAQKNDPVCFSNLIAEEGFEPTNSLLISAGKAVDVIIAFIAELQPASLTVSYAPCMSGAVGARAVICRSHCGIERPKRWRIADGKLCTVVITFVAPIGSARSTACLLTVLMLIGRITS
jgi:hypothetical protein